MSKESVSQVGRIFHPVSKRIHNVANQTNATHGKQSGKCKLSFCSDRSIRSKCTGFRTHIALPEHILGEPRRISSFVQPYVAR